MCSPRPSTSRAARAGKPWYAARSGQLAIRYYASVDEQGNLRVQAGELPFRKATSLADVQDRPGSVYHAPMVSTSDNYEPERDPFNGRN